MTKDKSGLYNHRETGEGTVVFWRNEGDAFNAACGAFTSIGNRGGIHIRDARDIERYAGEKTL